MTPDHEAFADWDAAYVLGALAPSDRRAYEQHLEDCERCRAAVAELAPLPGLLARARALVEDSDDPALRAGPPADLLDRVVRRRERQRRLRRGRAVAGIAAVAAAVALAIVLPLAALRPAPAAQTVVLAPVIESSMTATVELRPAAWGTRISMECDYPPGGDWLGEDGPWEYALVLIDDEGVPSQVGTWTAVPGRTVRLDASTALALDGIASIELRAASGQPILAAGLDG